MDGVRPYDEDDALAEVVRPKRELDLEIMFTN